MYIFVYRSCFNEKICGMFLRSFIFKSYDVFFHHFIMTFLSFNIYGMREKFFRFILSINKNANEIDYHRLYDIDFK